MESGENASRVEIPEELVAPPPVPSCAEACADIRFVPGINCAAAATSDICGEKSDVVNTTTVACEGIVATVASDIAVSETADKPGNATNVQNDSANAAAQVYESDDEVVEIARGKYRDISDSDSTTEDSEESSSTDSSSSTEDDPSDPESVAETRTIEVGTRQKPPRTDGEMLLEELPPIEELHITVPETDCMEVGKVSAIVNQMVVVQALKNTPALDLDSVLFLDKGKRTLGRIFDVIGPVCDPAYCVRFNSVEHIREKGIEKEMMVYCAPKTDHTSYVFLGELLKMKGSDASWKANNEPPAQFLDFSDDEDERRARRRKRQAGSSEAASREVVEPNSYERRMNAKNLARSQIPSRQQQPAPRAVPSSAPPPGAAPRGVGRGWVRPGVVIHNYHSAPMEPLTYPPPRRPGYTITRFGGQPAWPPSPNVMPMFPIPPPYQFGMGTGTFFPMPPPPHAMPPNLFSTPPPPPPPNPFRQHPPY